MEKKQGMAGMVIDLAVDTGQVKHGAAGFLYGLGNEDIPSVNVMAPLRPQVAAQKPEGGLQHPNGDALQVSDGYRAAGGREIEIYLQDVAPDWPYAWLGIEDYLGKVAPIVRQVAAHPNHKLFSFVPLNEPDQIWYNKSDRRQALLDDWRALFRRIRSIDPEARLVGPNFAQYDSDFYRDFLEFGQEHNCLPDVISWHELGDAFFSGWYARYDDYRRQEADLGIPPKEICINEYARIKGDLGVPGNLVQWIARFETSKVDACLAYWTDAGSLNNLVTRDQHNQATGAWWLYHWYAGLSGHTAQVSPPDFDAEGLQGIAAIDPDKKQVRILFGGVSGKAELDIRGFDRLPFLTGEAHIVLWETAASGFEPSMGPQLLQEGFYSIQDGLILMPLADLTLTSAYLMVIDSPRGQPSGASSGLYPAEYADLYGGACIEGSEQNGYNVRLDPTAPGGVGFVVTAGQDAFYRVCLRCRVGSAGGRVHLGLNGEGIDEVIIPPGDARVEVEREVFLASGINRINCETTAGAAGLVWIESLGILAGTSRLHRYPVGSSENVLFGTAGLMYDPAAPGGKYVGKIGDGPDNRLVFTGISAPKDGVYCMVVTFANAECRGGHSYNSQIVDRWAEVRVNGGPPRKIYFRNTFGWDRYRTRVVDVTLQAGENTIEFSNQTPGAFAPHIAQIEIAASMIK